MQHHRDHDQLAEQLRMALVDEAEQQISDLLHSQNEDVRKDAAKFILKTLGKSRGWTEQPQSQIIQQISSQDKAVMIKNIFGI